MKGSRRSRDRMNARERDFRDWWKRAEGNEDAPTPVLKAHGAFMAGYRACYRYDAKVPREPVLRALVTALELLQDYASQIEALEKGCPDAAKMGEFACADRPQCWEPCGELGNDAKHARRASPEDEAAVRRALNPLSSPVHAKPE